MQVRPLPCALPHEAPVTGLLAVRSQGSTIPGSFPAKFGADNLRDGDVKDVVTVVTACPQTA